MSQPRPTPAPDPVGETVPGAPPVPITVWHVPAPPHRATLSLPMAQRLVAGFTHPRQLVLDLTDGPQLARAAASAGRRHRPHHPDNLRHHHDPAALLVTPWPPAGQPQRVQFLTGCAGRLQPGGSVALVIATGEVTIHPQLVAAGHRAGLTYLQHYIAAHQLTAHGTRLTIHGQHLRVHTDVVVLHRPADREGG